MTRLPLIAALAGLTILPGCIQREDFAGRAAGPARAIAVPPDRPPRAGSPTATSPCRCRRCAATATGRSGRQCAARLGNEAIGAPARPVSFAVDIGAASDRRHRITADPIVAAGLVFTGTAAPPSPAPPPAAAASGATTCARRPRPAKAPRAAARVRGQPRLCHHRLWRTGGAGRAPAASFGARRSMPHRRRPHRRQWRRLCRRPRCRRLGGARQ